MPRSLAARRRFVPVAVRTTAVRMTVHQLEDRTQPGDVLLGGLLMQGGGAAGGVFAAEAAPLTRWLPESIARRSAADEWVTLDDQPAPRWATQPAADSPTAEYQPTPESWLSSGVFAWVGQDVPAVTTVAPVPPVVAPPELVSAAPDAGVRVSPSADAATPPAVGGADSAASSSIWDRLTVPATAGDSSAVTVGGGGGAAARSDATPLTTPIPKPPAKTVDLSREFTRTEILVGVRSADPLAVVRQLAAGAGSEVIDPAASRVILTSPDGVALVQVGLVAGTDPVAAVGMCQEQGWAEWAQLNYVSRDGKDWTPDDPQYAAQYFHTKAQTNLAWDVTKGTPNIVVAVTDDGVGYNHPDLTGNIWINPNETAGDGIDNDNNGYVDDVRGWDVNANDNNPLPVGSQTHGTHVSGIIAARSNNAVGVAGTAGGDGVNANTGVRIMPLRWEGANGWTAAHVATSYAYAADNGAKVINASYNFDFWVSGGVADPAVDAALTYAYNKGCLLMNSAGNSGLLNPPRGNVFSQPLFVASLNSADVRSGFSNYGKQIDISAHGSGILSTTTSADGTGVSYEVFDGTSMSTPHAAGAAALIWSQNPTWTRDQVAARLLGTTDSVDAANPTVIGLLGTGRINPFKGVSASVSVAAPVFTDVTVTAGSTAGTFVSVSVTVPRRLLPASVTPSNFTLVSDGADNTFGTGDDQAIPLALNRGAAYRMGTNQITFTPVFGGELPLDRYRLTGLSGAAALRDPFGTALDGDSNGTAGGNFVLDFGGNPQISGIAYEDWNGNGGRDANDPGIAGRGVYLDANDNGVFDSGTQTFVSNAVAVPDTNTPVYSDVSVSGLTSAVLDVNVRVNLRHTSGDHLDVFLVAPNGTRVELFTDVGGAGDHFTNTTLDDEAATAITAGSAPFTGPFRPEGVLSAVDGMPASVANGVWRLEVTDDTTGEAGFLDNWRLSFTTSSQTFRTDVPVNIQDLATVTSTVLVAGGPAVIEDLNVRLSLNHTFDADLVLTLVSPTGVRVPLAANRGGDGDNFTDTVFDDEALTPIAAGAAPFTGTFRPESPLSIYAGLSANGNWVLEIQDVSSGDLGTLSNWDVTFSSALVVGTPPPLAIAPTATPVFSDVTASGFNAPITDVNVRVNLRHTRDEDLDVFLVAPDGTRVELFTDVGGTGDHFTNTVLDDEAATPIAAGAAPFTGSFRPEGVLAALDGRSANGVWRLEVTDDTTGQTGFLNDWSLTIATAEQQAVAAANGAYAFLNLAPATYTIRPITPTGWTATGPTGRVVTLATPGSQISGQDFGSARHGRVYTHAFRDTNGNGVRDGGEVPAVGRTVFVDENENGDLDVAPPTTTSVSSGTIAVGIPDLTTVTHTIPVTGLGTIDDVNVRVNITHTFTGDLVLTLISPTGTRIPLSSRRGGGGQNFVNTIFDDEAATPISSGAAPFTGSFRPETPLSAVDGLSANGNWTLEVQDAATLDVGTLTEWAVIVTSGIPEPNMVTNSLGNAFFDGLSAAAHHILMTGQSGWAYTSPADGKHVVTVAAGTPNYQRTFGTVQPAPATAPSVLVNGIIAPSTAVTRSMVQSLRLTFNTPVGGVQAGAFSLTNGVNTITSNAGGGIATAISGNTVTLTFTAAAGVDAGTLSLSDGIWTLTTDLTKVLNLLAVAGTGTGTQGNIRRLFGDVNSDGTVDGTDFGSFGNTWGLAAGDAGFNAAFDHNADGTIDGTDFGQFGNRWGVQL